MLPAGVVLALLLAACNGDSPNPPGTGQASPTATVIITATAFPDAGDLPSPGASGTASPGAASPGATSAASPRAADARAAIEAAEAAVDGGRAAAIDFSSRRQVWRTSVISGDTEYEVLVSADGKEVLGRQEDGFAEPDYRSGLESAKTGLAEAVRTALEEVPGTLDEASLDEEDGKLVWEIEVDTADGSSASVDIDAAAGKPVR